ncbi:MAG: hypothetical protein AAB215_09540 [Planctomycetota bacterium]
MGATDTRAGAEAPRRRWRGSAGFVCLLCIAPALFAGATLGFRALRKAQAAAKEAERRLEIRVREDGAFEADGMAMDRGGLVRLLKARGNRLRGPDGISELDVTIRFGEAVPWEVVLEAVWCCQDWAVYLIALKGSREEVVLRFALPRDGHGRRWLQKWDPSNPPDRFRANLWTREFAVKSQHIRVALGLGPKGAECRLEDVPVSLRRNAPSDLPSLGERLYDMGSRSGVMPEVVLDAVPSLPAGVVLSTLDTILAAGYWEVNFQVPADRARKWSEPLN